MAGLDKENTSDTTVPVYHVCGVCGDLGHKSSQCQLGNQQGGQQEGQGEAVNQVQGDMNSNTYHPGLRNHPNFRYGNASNQLNPNFQPVNNQQQQYQQNNYQRQYYGNRQGGNYNNRPQNPPPNQQAGSSSNVSKIDQLVEMMKEMRKENELRDKAVAALTKQVGQIAEQVGQRQSGTLPSDTQVNPAHQGSSSKSVHINSVSLSSLSKVENVCECCLKKSILKEPSELSLSQQHKTSKMDKWETLKQRKINLPLLDVIEKDPVYVKCVKKLSTRKQHNPLPKQVKLTNHVNAVLTGTLPPKLQDPGMPLISIQIGDLKINRALLDLGAGISILPGSLYDKYDFGPLQEVDTTVVLADQTIKRPRGMLTDVIIKVEDFYYPVDFLVLDCEENNKDTSPTVILGRPFLATAQATVDCSNWTVGLRFGGRERKLSMFENVTNPVNDESVQVCSVTKFDRDKVAGIEQLEKHKNEELRKENDVFELKEAGDDKSNKPPDLESINGKLDVFDDCVITSNDLAGVWKDEIDAYFGGKYYDQPP